MYFPLCQGTGGGLRFRAVWNIGPTLRVGDRLSPLNRVLVTRE